MSPIYLRNEAILTSGNAIATSENCCCSGSEVECIDPNTLANCDILVDIGGVGFVVNSPLELIDCSDVGGHPCNCVKYTFSELCGNFNQFEKTIYGTVVENNGSFSIENQFTILNIQDENQPCPESSISLDFVGVSCN